MNKKENQLTLELQLTGDPDSYYKKILEIMVLANHKEFVLGSNTIESLEKEYGNFDAADKVFFFRGFLGHKIKS